MNYVSGYDPEANICWQFRNKGDRERRCKCPACSGDYRTRTLAWFGRCRSGARWFWAASPTFSCGKEIHGWADSEDGAMDAAMAAIRSFREEGVPLLVFVSHGWARLSLKKLNEAKRAARSPSDAKDSKLVEYLYGYSHVSEYFCPVRFRITKKTRKRVFYIRDVEWLDKHGQQRRHDNGELILDRDGRIGYVNRQKLEADGFVRNRGVHWSDYDSTVWASFEGLMAKFIRDDAQPESPDIRQLKAAMAAAHPDKGGSNAAFIAARRAYVAAKQRARTQGFETSKCTSEEEEDMSDTTATAKERDEGLQSAMEAAGGLRALARELGMSAQALSDWRRVPAHRILQVETVTKVPREKLRPEFYRARKR